MKKSGCAIGERRSKQNDLFLNKNFSIFFLGCIRTAVDQMLVKFMPSLEGFFTFALTLQVRPPSFAVVGSQCRSRWC